MQNENWALSSSNLIVARNCIKLIESEFGEKLRLSDESFLIKLGRYAKKTQSSRTLMMCSKLATATGEENLTNLTQSALKGKSKQPNTATAQPTSKRTLASPKTENQIEYRGKHYAKFDNAGKEFKGLYRGQARYA